MNILFISNQSPNRWSGPTYSIPNQVKAQSLVDNVFWFNLKEEDIYEWKETACFHSSKEFKSGKISSLPIPFNNPDIVVVEQFYPFTISKIRRDLMKSGIPYVIIPRGELTFLAQKKSSFKKRIANFLIMKRYANRAKGIIYLTNKELLDSGKKWNNNNYVIPNGIFVPKATGYYLSSDSIICSFIGRLSLFHKGIDLLLDACSLIKDDLIKNNVRINLYGPCDSEDYEAILKKIEENDLNDLVHIYDSVFGDEKKRVLESSSVFILTSRFEGHPMALIEALAYGLPCFVTTGTNMGQEIIENNCGWCSECDVLSISKSFLQMINEKSLFAKKSINAFTLSKKYDWSAIAEETHALLNSLIE